MQNFSKKLLADSISCIAQYHLLLLLWISNTCQLVVYNDTQFLEAKVEIIKIPSFCAFLKFDCSSLLDIRNILFESFQCSIKWSLTLLE